jgi:hypothetical protein
MATKNQMKSGAINLGDLAGNRSGQISFDQRFSLIENAK